MALMLLRNGSRTAATSKMERFVIIVNGWKLFINYYHKALHLGCAAALDPPLLLVSDRVRLKNTFFRFLMIIVRHP